MKRWYIALIAFGSLLIILVIPAIPAMITGKSVVALQGPALEDLEYEEVRFRSGDGINLAAMMFVPQGSGPFPAAVLIHGSGSSRRENRWYLGMAEALLKEGIAVLLPDKRGCESSGGQWQGAAISTLALDTEAAVDFLFNQETIQLTHIGLIGMSQGGWIAPVAASRHSGIDYVISFSGSPNTLEEQLLHEEYFNIGTYTYGFLAGWIAQLSTRSLLKNDVLKPLADFDPMPFWQNVHVPILFAFGGADTNVPVDAGIHRLDQSDLINHEILVYPEGGHGILDVDSGEIHGPTMDRIIEFIHEALSAI